MNFIDLLELITNLKTPVPKVWTFVKDTQKISLAEVGESFLTHLRMRTIMLYVLSYYRIYLFSKDTDWKVFKYTRMSSDWLTILFFLYPEICFLLRMQISNLILGFIFGGLFPGACCLFLKNICTHNCVCVCWFFFFF